jgi:cobalamin synthase
MPAGKESESSLGDLFGRLAEDGRAFVRAEAGLYKAVARRRAGRARNGAIALAAAALLANAALILLLVALALELAQFMRPILAGLIVVAAALIAAFLLVRYGAAKLKALSGDEEEKAALAAGERTA